MGKYQYMEKATGRVIVTDKPIESNEYELIKIITMQKRYGIHNRSKTRDIPRN